MPEQDIAREGFRLITPLRVRYHEVDLQNIVFNANYLIYADIGITEYYRALPPLRAHPDGVMDYFGPEHEVVVRHAELDYRASACADDMLDLGVRIIRFGNTSFTAEVAIFRSDMLLTVVRLRYVHCHVATRRPVALPSSFRALVEAFETVAPESA